MRCALCKTDKELLHEVEGPLLRVCCKCRDKLVTHMACICTGCDTLAWIRKTTKNVEYAAMMSGLHMDYLMDNAILHPVPECRRCAGKSEISKFTRSAVFH